MGVLCTWVKLSTDWQILAVNCTKMRLAAALRSDLLGSYSAPPHLLGVKMGVEGGNGKERVASKKGEEGEGMEGREGVERYGKRKVKGGKERKGEKW